MLFILFQYFSLMALSRALYYSVLTFYGLQTLSLGENACGHKFADDLRGPGLPEIHSQTSLMDLG